MISAFYSPARNIKEKNSVKSVQRAISVNRDFAYVIPNFELDKFERLVARQPSMTDMLNLSGELLTPRYLLRFDHLIDDLTVAMRSNSIDGWQCLSKKKRVNASYFNPPRELFSDKSIIEIVNKYHNKDRELQKYCYRD